MSEFSFIEQGATTKHNQGFIFTVILKKYFKYCFLQTTCLIFVIGSMAQNGFGQPVFKQDFGIGNSDPNTIGLPLPAGKTYFKFSDSVCPPPGSYTIIRRVPVQNCFNIEWINLTHDDNRAISFGMMMVVNNITNANNRIVYVDTINQALCAGALYNFSAAIINLDTLGEFCQYGHDFPVFELRVESGTGQLIKKDTIAMGVPYAVPLPYSNPYDYNFSHYGFNFSIPAGINKLVVKLTLLRSTYLCGEDFAIDDIQVRPVGPDVTSGFDNEPTTTIVKSVCFQDNKTVSMSGNMGAYYSNPSLQWQQSINGGIIWLDISGATAATYSRTFSTPDTFLFRLSGGDASNVSNPNCRVVSNVIKVEVDGLPKSYTIANNSPVCSGQDLKFKGEGAAAYLWTGPNGFYDNISSPHIFFSSLKDSGMYYVEVFSLGGCHVKDSTHVTIIGTDVHAGPDTVLCKGQSVQLKASKGASYAWLPSTGLSNTTSISPKASPGTTTVYTVTVTDKDGCSDTAQVEVKIKNKKEAKALIAGTEWLCRSSDTASFISKSTGDINSRYWDFGNGQTDFSEKPPTQHYLIPDNKNSYKVMLTIKDTVGCADTTYHILKIVDNCYIAVPTAFTPNNDGVNDFLSPLNAYKATNLLFRVFNRNGKTVFETRDWTKRWDGRLRGMEQGSGTYVWMLEYNDATGKKISLKGTTILIR